MANPRGACAGGAAVSEGRDSSGGSLRGDIHPSTANGCGCFSGVFRSYGREAGSYNRKVRVAAQRYSNTDSRSARHASSSGRVSLSRSAAPLFESSTHWRRSSLPLIKSIARRSCSYS